MENVVISGISGAFPECDNLRELWKNLIDKTDMTTADVDRLWNRSKYVFFRVVEIRRNITETM